MKYSISILLLLLLLCACSKNTPDAGSDLPPDEEINIPAAGSANSLEVVSWNIEMFPKTASTVSDVVEIIRDLDVDIIAMQEITSVQAFQQIVDSLPEYDGRVGTGATNGFALWPALLFRKSLVTLVSETYLFTNDSYLFPRAPYEVRLIAEKNGEIFDFRLLVLHLKASSGSENEARRRGAIQALENYLATRLQNSANDPDYVLAGDWNDLLEDPAGSNVFSAFLNKPEDYRFTTAPFAGSETEYTFIGGSFRSLIDHIMVTRAVDTSFVNSTEILKLDRFFPRYEIDVSDHRPVVTKFFMF